LCEHVINQLNINYFLNDQIFKGLAPEPVVVMTLTMIEDEKFDQTFNRKNRDGEKDEILLSKDETKNEVTETKVDMQAIRIDAKETQVKEEEIRIGVKVEDKNQIDFKNIDENEEILTEFESSPVSKGKN
jgi:hypothetical protein